MHSFLTVVRFTFFNRIRSKPFLITSVLFLLLITLGFNLPTIIDKFSTSKPTSVGMVDDPAGIAKGLQAHYSEQEEPAFDIVLVPSGGSMDIDDKQMLQKLEEQQFRGYLKLSFEAEGTFPSAVYKAENMLGSGKKANLQEALRQLKTELNSQSAGLSPDQLAKLFGPVPLETVQISTTIGEQASKTESERNTAFALVYILLFLLFMIVQLYGNLIATEITAEKSSRVMEIIITSVSPLKQMFGKITGMFLLGLTQILLFIAGGAFNLLVFKSNSTMLEQLGLNLKTLDVSLLGYFVVFFVLGFFLYATLLAGVGSLVSRTEDLGQAIMPVTLLSIASFYIAIYGLNNPGSAFITAMSFVPFFTPMLMFLRIGMIGVPLWQVALGFVVLLAGIFVFGWLAAKVYRVGVLMYGKRPTMREVIKAMRAFKV